MRSVEDTVVLIATLIKSSTLTRARLSMVTVRQIARISSKKLSMSYVRRVRDMLEADYNIIMFELDRGGFGVLVGSALEGAKPIVPGDTFNRTITTMEYAKLKDELEAWSDQALKDEED